MPLACVNIKKYLLLKVGLCLLFFVYILSSGNFIPDIQKVANGTGFATHGNKGLLRCPDIFEIRRHNPNSTSKWVKIASNVIRELKETKEFLFEEAYFSLGIDNLNTVEQVQNFKGINGTNITLPYKSLLDKLNWQIPHLPCKLREYKAEDVKVCIEKRFDFGMRTRIAYIGDSKMRQQMEVLLDLLHPFNLSIMTSEKENISLDDFLGFKGSKEWSKYKDRLNITCQELPGLLIKFIWAPNLPKGNKEYSKKDPYTRKKRKKSRRLKSFWPKKNYTQNFEVGAYDALKYMDTRPKEELDDLILLGGGTWQLHSGDDILDNIDVQAIHGMQKLYPLLDSLATKTSVVMMLPEPFKEYMFNSKSGPFNYFFLQNNANLQWYLNAQAQLLPRSVLLWDSFIPFGYGAINDCIDLLSSPQIAIESLPPYSRFEPKSSYACYERIHIGFRNIYTSVQQLLNHICNNIMTENFHNFCCSK